MALFKWDLCLTANKDGSILEENTYPHRFIWQLGWVVLLLGTRAHSL